MSYIRDLQACNILSGGLENKAAVLCMFLLHDNDFRLQFPQYYAIVKEWMKIYEVRNRTYTGVKQHDKRKREKYQKDTSVL